MISDSPRVGFKPMEPDLRWARKVFVCVKFLSSFWKIYAKLDYYVMPIAEELLPKFIKCAPFYFIR